MSRLFASALHMTSKFLASGSLTLTEAGGGDEGVREGGRNVWVNSGQHNGSAAATVVSDVDVVKPVPVFRLSRTSTSAKEVCLLSHLPAPKDLVTSPFDKTIFVGLVQRGRCVPPVGSFLGLVSVPILDALSLGVPFV